MSNPTALMSIRLSCFVTGGLLAMLPRSIRWKLSLYASRQLLVAGVVIERAITTSSLEPIRSLAVDACAPYLLALGAGELSMRSLRRNGLA